MATVMIDCGGKSAAQLIITCSAWQPRRGWTLSGWRSRAGCGIMRPLGGAGHDGATLQELLADLAPGRARSTLGREGHPLAL